MTKDPSLVKSHDVHLDSDYVQWLHELKERYRKTQIKAAVKVNAEQLLFNRQMGRDLVQRRAEDTWGSGIVEQVSLDLQAAFPDVKGFSARNLWSMKKWYSFYAFSQSSMTEFASAENTLNLHDQKLHQLGEEMQEKKLNQPGAEIPFPELFAFVPWRHHVEIITKCKSVDEALFYVRKTAEEGWSRSTLQNYMAADLYQHTGAAVTNFAQHLPAAQSRLAQEITKDT